ncbi:MAG: peptide ABC transporter substrate-binding protein [Candidatus Eremiobacteraeota bacterium]|nr:peptide ABC transporter substrate-binding protein [Candidatus Eremiobacteraeota bacterium]
MTLAHRAAALALAATILLSACTRLAPSARNDRAPHPWTHPDTLRIAMSGSPNTLDPILSTQQFEIQVEAFVFDVLVATDDAGHDVPRLAARVPTLENGDISKDGRTIVYHLRRNVLWQDGAPFTSADVAFSWHAIMNPNTAVATRHGYDQIERIDTPDRYTAIFRLLRPFAPAIHTFFAFSDSPIGVLPAHLLARYPNLNRIPFNSSPVGTGPYRVVRWLRGDRIEFVANDRYFLGKPHIRNVVIHFVPDENTIIGEVRSHEIDWFVQATPRVYPQLRNLPGGDVRLVPFNGSDSIIFNTARAPFLDPRLRRAVGFAIDKAALVRKVTFATTMPASEDLPSFMWAYDPGAGTMKQNVTAAKMLLDAAGWRAVDAGARVKMGRRLTLDLAFRTDSITDRNRGVVIGAMLAAVGIDVHLKGYQTALLYAPPGDNGILSSGHYEASLQTWYAGVDPDDSTQLLCDERAPRGYNWALYCNHELDAAEAVALSHYDRPTRTRAYASVQRLLARDAPFVYLWWPRQIEAVNVDLLRFRPNGIVEPWNAYEWSLDGGGHAT